ncbi:hypothetical protein EMEDMD4_1310057 [Sinorhizobium medicae]|uniref:Uncharacterized protein n=1 Tax=Sinorhizobium medicae TaxID=110321 RepID=A0A508WS47_9HYPH|nr:hypothetical protein EMEDMD4_1310057 [Sinorhizobium medicae]
MERRQLCCGENVGYVFDAMKQRDRLAAAFADPFCCTLSFFVFYVCRDRRPLRFRTPAPLLRPHPAQVLPR